MPNCRKKTGETLKTSKRLKSGRIGAKKTMSDKPTWKIEPRDGIEVTLEYGVIILEQVDNTEGGSSRIAVHPSDVPQLVKYLQAAVEKHLDTFKQTGEESQHGMEN
jgi:hypothetical protein